jgi:HK97 family phage prohead protease
MSERDDQMDDEQATLVREVSVDLEAEGDGRTLISRLVPYNEIATVSDGGAPYEEMFLPGAFKAQMRAAHRIKAFLNFRHRQGLEDQIGYARSIEDRADGLHGELRVLDGPDGDKALALLEAGVLDKLSVEFQPLKDRIVNGVVQRVSARLVGVGLVPQGSYPSAAVLAVREQPEDDADDEDEVGTIEPPTPLGDEMIARLQRMGVRVPAELRLHQIFEQGTAST